MKNRGIFLALLVFSLFGFLSFVSAADPGHTAGSIGAGTFESGNYVFPGHLNVSGNLTVNSFVGIGMRASTYRLNVNGIINASGILINGTPLSLGTFNATYDAFWNSNATIWNAINSVPTSINQTATYIPYVGANKNSDLGTWNLTASWLKGTFGWIINSSSSTYLNFNGTNLALTSEVTKWLYNQSTVAVTDYAYVNSVLQGNLSANISNVYSNINISATGLYTNLTAYINGNVSNLVQRINISATGLYTNLTAYINGNVSNLVQRINISDTILYNNITTYANNNILANLTTAQQYTNTQIIGNFTANLTAINSNLTSSFVPYVGANRPLNLGINNLTIDTNVFKVDINNNRVGIGQVNPDARLDIEGELGLTTNLVTIGTGSSLGDDLNIGGGQSRYGLYLGPSFNVSANGALRAAGTYVWAGAYSPISRTLPELHGVYIAGLSKSGGATVTNAYGLYVNSPLAGDTNVAAYIGGRTGINTTVPQSTLHVNGDVYLNASAVGGNVIIQL